ncbi:MAG: hypothetical protein AB7O97_21310 [Planctomycetota bacterium]
MRSTPLAPSLTAAPLAAALLVAALATTAPAQNQCQTPVGNCTLSIGGIPQPGQSLRFSLQATPLAPMFLVADVTPGPTVLTGIGTFCVGPSLFWLTGQALSPLQVVPGSGYWSLETGIPQVPSLVGTTFFFQAFTFDLSAPNGKIAISNVPEVTIEPPSSYTTVFFDGFNAPNPFGSWSAPNPWKIDTPASPSPWNGANANAANYPATGVNAILTSPLFPLPTVNPGERILLRFQIWCDTEDGVDYVELMAAAGLGGSLQPLAGAPRIEGQSRGWTQCGADLTALSGQVVRLGFRMFSTNCTSCGGFVGGGQGPFVDDVHVFVAPPPSVGLAQNWDGNADSTREWYADNGLWQTGPRPASVAATNTRPPDPTSPPNYCGTLLDLDYPATGANSRLISPPFIVPPPLPPAVVPSLRFASYIHSEPSWDVGIVQYSLNGGVTWTTFPSPPLVLSGYNTAFSPSTAVDLIDGTGASLVGATIQVAFRFSSSNCTSCGGVVRDGAGWFVDDIRVQ